jgi:hypothetical protein
LRFRKARFRQFQVGLGDIDILRPRAVDELAIKRLRRAMLGVASGKLRFQIMTGNAHEHVSRRHAIALAHGHLLDDAGDGGADRYGLLRSFDASGGGGDDLAAAGRACAGVLGRRRDRRAGQQRGQHRRPQR